MSVPISRRHPIVPRGTIDRATERTESTQRTAGILRSGRDTTVSASLIERSIEQIPSATVGTGSSTDLLHLQGRAVIVPGHTNKVAFVTQDNIIDANTVRICEIDETGQPVETIYPALILGSFAPAFDQRYQRMREQRIVIPAISKSLDEIVHAKRNDSNFRRTDQNLIALDTAFNNIQYGPSGLDVALNLFKPFDKTNQNTIKSIKNLNINIFIRKLRKTHLNLKNLAIQIGGLISKYGERDEDVKRLIKEFNIAYEKYTELKRDLTTLRQNCDDYAPDIYGTSFLSKLYDVREAYEDFCSDHTTAAKIVTPALGALAGAALVYVGSWALPIGGAISYGLSAVGLGIAGEIYGAKVSQEDRGFELDKLEKRILSGEPPTTSREHLQLSPVTATRVRKSEPVRSGILEGRERIQTLTDEIEKDSARLEETNARILKMNEVLTQLKEAIDKLEAFLPSKRKSFTLEDKANLMVLLNTTFNNWNCTMREMSDVETLKTIRDGEGGVDDLKTDLVGQQVAIRTRIAQNKAEKEAFQKHYKMSPMLDRETIETKAAFSEPSTRRTFGQYTESQKASRFASLSATVHEKKEKSGVFSKSTAKWMFNTEDNPEDRYFLEALFNNFKRFETDALVALVDGMYFGLNKKGFRIDPPNDPVMQAFKNEFEAFKTRV